MSPSAAVIITGGGGFLGQCLTSALLTKGHIGHDSESVPIGKVILGDIFFAQKLQPAIEANAGIVTKLQGDISKTEYVQSLFDAIPSTATHVSVFHLGAVMSGDGERDFDLCMRVNLHGFMNMIEGARNHHDPNSKNVVPKFIFASAGATIGSGAPTDYITKEDTISDGARATPHTTYGATKACCELLLTDYARRGLVNARGVRLPTIVVRAGAPNAATTSCFSGVVREPLSGKPSVLPIRANVPHAVTGYRAAISAMLTVHDASNADVEQILGFDRTVFLPSIALSLGDLEQALYKVVTEESRIKLGKISYDVNDQLSAVVGSFPTKIDASRAMKLGILPAPDAETLVREYIEDFPSALADGIKVTPLLAAEKVIVEKVAVVTGGGSGIGRAVAQRLSRGGWAVVLAGRRMDALHETKASLLEGAECLCVSTDVTSEQEVNKLFEKTEALYGKVDLLFNNAGVNSPAASVENVSLGDFERVLKTNVSGPFLCARAAMRLMAKTGTGGRIINNGSISAQVPRPHSVCYTSSKHALSGLTKCVALDGRAINVACGQIDFGNVVTDLSLATNKVGSGALQPDGSRLQEPSMRLSDAAETVWTMANLPLEANVLQMTALATAMPFVGRG